MSDRDRVAYFLLKPVTRACKEFDLRAELEPWFRELGIEYHFVPFELPPEEPLPLNCSRCSWNRRKALFTAAVGQSCNKLAFGHHADDAAATALLNPSLAFIPALLVVYLF